jgi:hypothetical protein
VSSSLSLSSLPSRARSSSVTTRHDGVWISLRHASSSLLLLLPLLSLPPPPPPPPPPPLLCEEEEAEEEEEEAEPAAAEPVTPCSLAMRCEERGTEAAEEEEEAEEEEVVAEAELESAASVAGALSPRVLRRRERGVSPPSPLEAEDTAEAEAPAAAAEGVAEAAANRCCLAAFCSSCLRLRPACISSSCLRFLSDNSFFAPLLPPLPEAAADAGAEAEAEAGEAEAEAEAASAEELSSKLDTSVPFAVRVRCLRAGELRAEAVEAEAEEAEEAESVAEGSGSRRLDGLGVRSLRRMLRAAGALASLEAEAEEDVREAEDEKLGRGVRGSSSTIEEGLGVEADARCDGEDMGTGEGEAEAEGDGVMPLRSSPESIISSSPAAPSSSPPSSSPATSIDA